MPLPVDWNADDGSFKEGNYLAVVRTATFKYSQKSDPMLNIVLDAVEFGRKLCYDTIMLGGSGWGIGKSKLKAIGIVEGSEFEAEDLIGRHVYVRVKPEAFNGRTNMKVDISVGHCGYWPESEPPPVIQKPNAAPLADDVPF